MLLEPYWENITIYGENLSLFYLVCAIVSFLAVWFTWNACPKTELSVSKEDLTQTSNSHLGIPDEPSEEAFNNKADKKKLLKTIEEHLTFDDKVQESITEMQQLLDIFEHMKKDEKFNSMTLEELQEQLKLYRE